MTGTGKDWYYHWKAEELTRVNKSGLVPTLIAMNPETGETDESKVCGIFRLLIIWKKTRADTAAFLC